jgi:hypothetical protein
MAMPTRETSGLVVKIGRKGRMSLFVHGKKVPAIVDIQCGSKFGESGIATVSLLSQFITFEHEEAPPNVASEPPI